MAEEPKQQNVDYRNTMLAGVISGSMARIPMHPIDTIKAKLQVETSSRVEFFKTLRTTFRMEGVPGLYRGFSIAFAGSAPASCLYFGSYEVAKSYLRALPFLSYNPFIADFSAGLVAECASCVLWVPIDVVKERLQVQSKLSDSSLKYRGGFSAIASILRQEGLMGLYRGYGATVASFGPLSAIYLAGHEKLKIIAQTALGLKSVSDLPAPYIFGSGALAGAVAAFVTNPLDMAKLRLQVQRGDQTAFNFGYRNFWDGMLKIAKVEGMKGLFRGAGARMGYQAPAVAITIGTYDSIKNWLASVDQTWFSL